MPEAQENAAKENVASKPKGALILRQLEAIKRQKSDKGAPKAKAAPKAVSSQAVSAATPGTVSSSGPPRVRVEKKSYVRLKAAKELAARRLGLPLKGETGGLWKRSIRNSGIVAAARAGALATKVAATSKLRSDAMPELRSTAVTKLRSELPAKRPAQPVARVAQVATAVARVRGAPARSLAAAVLATARAVAGRPAHRARVRPMGIAGALLPVKKQEDSDNEAAEKRPLRSQGTAPKVITVPQPEERTPARPAPRLAKGFGYGHGSAGSDDSVGKDAPAVNGRRPKPRPQQGSARRQPRERQDVRSRNIVGTMLGHLKTAKRELSDERTGIKVKEEARWEPKDPVPSDGESPAEEQGNEDSDEEEPVVPPPGKRAKLRKEDRREREQRAKAEEAKADAVEMQGLQRRLESHYSSMKNFIRTRAEPTIFYLPAKHNDETKKQLEETRSAINHKITSLKAHLQSNAIDDSDDASGE